MSRSIPVEVHLGPNAQIDDNVLLGYLTSRSISHAPVSIGSDAVVRSGSVIYDSVTIGDRFQTGHYVIVREENQIGDDVCLWSHSVVDYGCRIGHRVKIHTKVYIAQFSVIEDEVFIAPGVTFANDKYPVSPNLKGPYIRRGARIGVNAAILPGVVVGEASLVGGGSVVTRDVPKGVVVAGNPAKIMGTVDEILKKAAHKKAC